MSIVLRYKGTPKRTPVWAAISSKRIGDNDPMQVDLYVYKVAKEFADDVETRYIAQAHLCGTPEHRWFGADSLGELYDRLRGSEVRLPPGAWSAIESALEARGGAETPLDMDEVTFAGIFT